MTVRLAALVAALLPVQGASAAEQMVRDCDRCPDMVIVPAGSFQMGSPPHEEAHSQDEGPVHTVTFANAFAIGKHEVTRAQFAAFVADTGHPVEPGCYADDGKGWYPNPDYTWQEPGYDQTDREPVVCVAWQDAVAYAAWLSRITGQAYRLPSEAEWEYAARGGTTTVRFWGDDSALACGFANGYDLGSEAELGVSWTPHACDDGAVRTAAVGSYAANGFGLHDMLGNVWEWTADCGNDGYEGTPVDGTAWTRGPCDTRMVRGGGWYYGPMFVRAAERTSVKTSTRIFDMGFRVARDAE